MKVSVRCKSPLLESALKSMLEGMTTRERDCDLILADEPYSSDKPVLLIGSFEGAHLLKPFSRAQLLKAIHHRLKPSSEELPRELEERLEMLTRIFVRKVVETILEYYEK